MTELKPNDILYTSWGYDQTNIDFIKVKELSKTGKTVKAVRIAQKIEKVNEFMSENVLPDPNNELSKPFQLKVSTYKDKPELRGSYIFCHDSKRFDYFWIWEGKSLYQSHYA